MYIKRTIGYLEWEHFFSFLKGKDMDLNGQGQLQAQTKTDADLTFLVLDLVWTLFCVWCHFLAPWQPFLTIQSVPELRRCCPQWSLNFLHPWTQSLWCQINCHNGHPWVQMLGHWLESQLARHLHPHTTSCGAQWTSVTVADAVDLDMALATAAAMVAATAMVDDVTVAIAAVTLAAAVTADAVAGATSLSTSADTVADVLQHHCSTLTMIHIK